jgi:hypothetical protein
MLQFSSHAEGRRIACPLVGVALFQAPVSPGPEQAGIEAKRHPVFRLGFGRFPAARAQQPEIEMRLRPVGLGHFGGDELLGGLDEGRLPL